MSRTLFLINLFALACWGSETLRIGTFNCEFLNEQRIHIKYGYRFELEEPADIAAWTSDRRSQKLFEASEAIAKAIAPLDVDIWCFTEVGDDREVTIMQQALARQGRELPYWCVGTNDDSSTGQHVAVMSRFPLEIITLKLAGSEYYDAELDDAYTEKEAWVQKGLHVKVTLNERLINLFVLHLTSEMGGHDKDEQRIAQATIVRRTYLPLLQSGQDVIVAGDLNDDIGQPAIRRIRGRHDIGEDLIQTADRLYVEPKDWNDRWTYNFHGEYNVIDHILVSKSLVGDCPKEEPCIHTRVVPLLETEHFKQRDRFTLSDHRPLLVELTLKPAKGATP